MGVTKEVAIRGLWKELCLLCLAINQRKRRRQVIVIWGFSLPFSEYEIHV